MPIINHAPVNVGACVHRFLSSRDYQTSKKLADIRLYFTEVDTRVRYKFLGFLSLRNALFFILSENSIVTISTMKLKSSTFQVVNVTCRESTSIQFGTCNKLPLTTARIKAPSRKPICSTSVQHRGPHLRPIYDSESSRGTGFIIIGVNINPWQTR